MKKRRNISKEIIQSVNEFTKFDEGKITLRTHKFTKKPRPKINADLIRATREKLHMSRAVFALKIHTSLRTLEKWEHGETIPNDQAAVLILMVRKYPDTLKRLEKI